VTSTLEETYAEQRSTLHSIGKLELTKDLLRGSVSLHLKPVRYIETPAGYGDARLHRYRVQVQLAIDLSISDALEAASVGMTAQSARTEVERVLEDELSIARGKRRTESRL
jgi:hypothetical protein